jgi:hypothetical protein
MANQEGSLISLDVFISFSRQDVGAADGVCQALEVAGIRCWMAHRDIAPGRGYLGPVLEAADRCRAVLLIVSAHTTTSNIYILDRATGRGVPIIWFMIDHATPPAEFNRFRESALLIDASVPPLEPHFRSLPARVNSLLEPTRTEDRPTSFSPPAEGPSARYSPDELVLLPVRAAALEVGLPSGAGEDEAIDSALRTVAEVLSEIHAPESQITALDAAVRTGPMPPLAVRERWPTASARSGLAHPSIRPTPPNSRKQHTKRDFALVVAGLAVLALGAGVLFNQQITGLLHAIEEFLRHQSVGAGEASEIAKLGSASSLFDPPSLWSFSILAQAAASASRLRLQRLFLLANKPTIPGRGDLAPSELFHSKT